MIRPTQSLSEELGTPKRVRVVDHPFLAQDLVELIIPGGKATIGGFTRKYWKEMERVFHHENMLKDAWMIANT